MRKEADDTGPMAELEHWRQLQARFSSIIEQIKKHESKMIINILHIAKSKVLKVSPLLSSDVCSKDLQLFDGCITNSQ